ncbi:MAG: ecotin family protein [Flavobacteriaceae bacterium]|jgi:ecotin|nr:ecotin family protein [Flavobacteriaceae bacterium]
MKKVIGLLIAVLGLSFTVTAQEQVYRLDASIFPKPEKGYKQVVIDVPHSTEDNNKRIEFSVGKYAEVDGCNHYSLMGKLEEKNLEGWGYTYFEFKSDGNMTSTLMGCPDAPKRNLFVTATPQLVRYNGKLPIIIYVPQDYQVKFKVFATNGEEFIASENRYKASK